MNIIDRYVLRVHAGPFVFGISIILFLFLIQFVILAIDELVGKGLDFWVITQLIVLNMAWMLVLTVPIGILFATLMAFGNMSATHEVTIIKASGRSLIRMMAPVVLIASILAIALFLFNDKVLPETNFKADMLMNDIRRTKPTFSLESGRFSTGIDGYTILSRKVDSLTGTLLGVTIYDHRNLDLLNVVSSDSGKVNFKEDYSKLLVTLYNGEIHQILTGAVSSYKIIDFKKHIISIPASGFSLEITENNDAARGDRELSIAAMKKITKNLYKKAADASARINQELDAHFAYLSGTPFQSKQKLVIPGDIIIPKPTEREILTQTDKRLGFLRSRIQSDLYQENEYTRRTRQFEVEIQKKYAIPFACIVFVFIGCPLGVITKGGNFGVSAVITLGFYIIYWACLIGGEKLADRDFISPELSMWLANIVILFMGLILTTMVNYDSNGIHLPGFIKKIIR